MTDELAEIRQKKLEELRNGKRGTDAENQNSESAGAGPRPRRRRPIGRG